MAWPPNVSAADAPDAERIGRLREIAASLDARPVIFATGDRVLNFLSETRARWAQKLFLQWEDWYRPSHEAFADAFDRREAETLRAFHDVFTAVRDCCMDRRMPLAQLVQTTAWKRYSSAARSALMQLRSALAAA